MKQLWFTSLFFYSFLFSNPISYELNPDSTLQLIKIEGQGSIEYRYDQRRLLTQILRWSESGDLLYQAQYVYDQHQNLIKERLIENLGTIEYTKNERISPYHKEHLQFDDDKKLQFYSFNGESIPLIPNQEKKRLPKWTLDDQGRLLEAKNEKGRCFYSYPSEDLRILTRIDPEGVVSEYQIFSVLGEEIALFDGKQQLLELKIPGLRIFPTLSKPIAFEILGKPYAPILDHFFNLRFLIDPLTQTAQNQFFFNLFGQLSHEAHPLTCFFYRQKMFDPIAECYFFGMRYYSPTLMHFLSDDPLGSIQSKNLKQYCQNNPAQWIDPDGQFYISIPVLGDEKLDPWKEFIRLLITIGLEQIPKRIELWRTEENDRLRDKKLEKVQQSEPFKY